MGRASTIRSLLVAAALCISFLGPDCTAQAQNGLGTDSLQKRLQTSEGLDRVQTLRRLFDVHLYSKPAKALTYAREAFDEVRRLDLDSEMAPSLMDLGSGYHQHGRLSRALEYFSRALEIYEDAGNVRGVAEATAQIGEVYIGKGDSPKALDHYLRALTTFREIEYQNGIAAALDGLGVIHENRGELAKSFDYHMRAADLSEKIGDQKMLADALNNVGIVLRQQGKYDEAIAQYERAVTAYSRVGSKWGLAAVSNNLGILLTRRGRPDQALPHLFRAIRLSEEMDEVRIGAHATHGASQAYSEIGNQEKALEYGRKSVGAAEEMMGSSFFFPEPFKTISAIYEALGDHEQALLYYKRYTQAKDSLFNEDKERLFKQMQARYNAEKRKRKIEQLEQDNQIQMLQARTTRWMLLGGLGGALLLAGLFYNRTRLKQRANRMLQEQKEELQDNRDKLRRTVEQKELLLKETHHRVKNNLQVIASLLNLQIDELQEPDAFSAMRDAQGRVQSMAIIHQKLYREDSLKVVDMQEYVEDLGQYVIRTFNARQVTVDVHAHGMSLDIDTAVPLGLIINELLSNTCKHAFPGGKGRVRVELERQAADRCVLKVSDDGIGLKRPAVHRPTNTEVQLEEKDTQSMGLSLVKDLTQQLGGRLLVENGNGLTHTIYFDL